MRLVVAGRAATRLRDIGSHIARDNPAASLRVERAFREAFDRLVAQPGLGRPFSREVRRYIMPRLPYLIFYRPDESTDELLILTVRHAKQRPLS